MHSQGHIAGKWWNQHSRPNTSKHLASGGRGKEFHAIHQIPGSRKKVSEKLVSKPGLGAEPLTFGSNYWGLEVISTPTDPCPKRVHFFLLQANAFPDLNVVNRFWHCHYFQPILSNGILKWTGQLSPESWTRVGGGFTPCLDLSVSTLSHSMLYHFFFLPGDPAEPQI